jgi:hypothetical protein
MTTSSNECCKPSYESPKCGCGSGVKEKAKITALPPIDRGGDILCRLSNRFRMDYKVTPGLYTIGNPTSDMPVLVTANYRLSCNQLRDSLVGKDVWVLVIDTKGINVWCAAGKGTFGTAEIVNRIACTGLADIVKHRTIILPQLGAPGVAADEVKKTTGFHVHYGPVRSHDIPHYLDAGNKATNAMRTVNFPLWERLILTPMELLPVLRKFLWIILGCVVIMGIQPAGILYKPAFAHSWPIVVLGLFAILIGTTVGPALLFIIPFRGFAAKGALIGAIGILPSLFYINQFFCGSWFLAAAAIIFFTVVASYSLLNFTGCTPFTSMSGVKKEMRFAVPAYLTALAISAVLLIIFKVHEWGIL